MRRFMVLAFLTLAWGQPAQADIIADYYVWGPLGPSMRVEASDNGDARIQMHDEIVGIRRGGIFYLVRRDAQGSFAIREDEFARVEARRQSETGGLPAPPFDLSTVRLVERGRETVGGHEGAVLVLEAPGEPASDGSFAFVVSSDSDLAPIGPVVAKIFGIGVGSPFPMGDQVDEILARGTLIRMAFMLRLERTSHESIPEGAFELPGPILNGDEAEARLGRAW